MHLWLIPEDCVYTGEILDETSGDISTLAACQEFYESYFKEGCKYWIYDKTDRKYSLRKSGGKNCQTWAGNRHAAFDDCNSKLLSFK